MLGSSSKSGALPVKLWFLLLDARQRPMQWSASSVVLGPSDLISDEYISPDLTSFLFCTSLHDLAVASFE
jgi:hypothetical protein